MAQEITSNLSPNSKRREGGKEKRKEGGIKQEGSQEGHISKHSLCAEPSTENIRMSVILCLISLRVSQFQITHRHKNKQTNSEIGTKIVIFTCKETEG